MNAKDVSRICYPGQEPEEYTKLVIYKHWPYLAPAFMGSVIIIGLSIAFITYSVSIKNAVFALTGIGLILVAIIFLLLSFWIWRNNMGLITNKHIVDIDQYGLFSKSVATLTLDKIQDIKASIKGFWQTIFRYGTLEIQTAGEHDNFIFDYVSDPYFIKSKILEVHREFRNREHKKVN